ncbi:RNA-directed DNA polymerase, eukaryota, reverse transcriptase zinc-binding domain protein [Tanacetum coccineum]
MYVSNFPSHLTIRELWNICGKFGTLVDVYIAKRKNKLGQMFAFCRYIKVANSNALIDSLSYVWIGKLRLHANVALFDRNVTMKSTDVKVDIPKDARNDGKRGPVTVNDERGDDNSVIDIQHGGFLEVDIKYLGGLWILFDFNSLEARDKFLNHKGIMSLFSSLKPWHDDFVVEERLVWVEIEGVTIRAWENDTFKSICNKWGDMLFCDDSDKCNRLSKRLFIKSSHSQLIFATTFMTLNKITYANRVRELCSRTPNFLDYDSDSDEEEPIRKFDTQSDKAFVDSDVESITDILTDEDREHVIEDKEHIEKDSNANVGLNEPPEDNDPFGLDPLINKKKDKVSHSINSDTPPFPTSFTPATSGFSMLERLEEMIKVGMALGLNMEGCKSTLASLVADKGDHNETKMPQIDLWMIRQAWGNTYFDFASTLARGQSSGILFIWNSLVFIKHKILCTYNYEVVDGLWTPRDVQKRWIVVYVPQNLASKIDLWTSLSSLMSNWDCILVFMGDFNEVHDIGERYGSVVNERQTNLFNKFIFDSSLLDIPLGGYNYNWTNKWGSKMSKLYHFLVSDSFYDKCHTPKQGLDGIRVSGGVTS